MKLEMSANMIDVSGKLAAIGLKSATTLAIRYRLVRMKSCIRRIVSESVRDMFLYRGFVSVPKSPF